MSATGCSNSRSASAGASSRSARSRHRLDRARGDRARPRALARVPMLDRRRGRRAGLLAVAGADDRRRHVRAAVGAALRRRADVPLLRAVRGGRAAHGGAAGRRSASTALARVGPAAAAGWPARRSSCSPPRSTRSRRSALWRDVLPTAAHRWVMQQRRSIRALDCAPLTPGIRVGRVADERPDRAARRRDRRLRRAAICRQARRRRLHAPAGAARHPRRASGSTITRCPPDFAAAARFADGDVFAVTAPTPLIYTPR